jgi:hypothetical protein
MTLEDDLARTADAAQRLATGGEQVVAVLAAEPAVGVRVDVVAFRRGEELAYVALDGRGEPIGDRHLVADAVTLVALVERAEEVSAATAADALEHRFADVATRVSETDAALAEAARSVSAAAARVAAAAAGPRVATPTLLDRLGAAAAQLGSALDVFAAEAERVAGRSAAEPELVGIAEIAWSALAEAARAGDPAGFAQSMTAGSASVGSLVEDVLGAYMVALDDPDGS